MAWLATSSWLDSQTEPHHTPAAPRASAAAICAPDAMPPAASTGRPPARATTSGVSTMVAIVPVWPPASVPCATSRSTPAASWRSACLGAPTSAATTTPAAWPRSTRSGGGVPRALAISAIRWLNAASSSDSAPAGLTLAQNSSARSPEAGRAGGPGGHAVPIEQAADEGQVLVRDLRAQAGHQVAGVAGRELLRDEQVHAVRAAAGLLLDPGQLGVELVRPVAGRGQHTQPPALQTAATTAGDRLKPAIGRSTPTRSVNAVHSIGTTFRQGPISHYCRR